MAEQEVIKHTKKIFGVWKTENSFLHKLSEFLLEIVIIVFAISLSIYVHDRSELRHQHRETKEFMLGLKEDLKTDSVEMSEDKNSYEQCGKAFHYITSIKMKEIPNRDSMKEYYHWMFNTTGLVPNIGRFEGFKSSGKIGTIENKELQNNIMDLYQEDIPSLIIGTDKYTATKERLFQYIAVNMKRTTDSTTNLLAVLSTDEAFNICNSLVFVKEIIERYNICIDKMKMITDEINKEYGE